MRGAIRHLLRAAAAIIILIALAPIHLAAALRLPALFSEHLVLQGGQPTAIWGWAGAGSRVEIAFVNLRGEREGEADATADGAGRWSTKLPALPPGDAGSLKITEKEGETKVIEDVAVGQAWLGGGQSNMTYRVGAANVSAETLAEAKRQAAECGSSIRYFFVTSRGADEPRDDVAGKWVVAAPDNVAGCSAVAWYFGLALHRKLHEPIGLIVSAVAGTPAESWIPRPEFDATRVSAAIWQRYREAIIHYTPAQTEKYNDELAAWLVKYPTPLLEFNNSHSHPREPYSPTYAFVPVRLYNGMIHGLEPYTLKGVIWFQGDGNGPHPEEYPELIKTLIKTWRKHWGAELPFYYVEVNNIFALQQKPVEPGLLAPIREAQNAALELPRTGVVCTIDLGIAADAHFPVKQPVGDRLAGLVLSEVYGLPMGEVYSPQFARFSIEGNLVRLFFDHAAGLKTVDGGPVKGFAIRGADGGWVWAEGQIRDNDVVLSSPQVPHPVAVRYGWANNPIVSIENGAGLPLRPFRTDKEISE